ncbi:hypothetical protein HGRIS_009606 [Hohenbuehelia grisea]|uniref:Uncharacterized protein n=1 Tax=Hohenbuehelia grisea TaxID=104357 RepID=A0ABR3J1W0_9AGAR
MGMFRGSAEARMRFLAENAHRAPTTLQGWYFYNKTSNYRVLLGGLKGAGADGVRLAAVGLGWVGLEDGLERIGLVRLKSVGAGLGTALVVSGLYRLSLRGTGRAVVAGVVTGTVMGVLEWTREWLR